MSSPSRPTPPPWPAQTSFPTPPPPHAGKRKRAAIDFRARTQKFERAEIANETEINQAKDECFDTNNSVYSCWPTADTLVDQNQSTQFVWNSKLPQFTREGAVNIGLFRADTGDVVKTFSNESNPSNRAGSIAMIVDDDWWGSDGPRWDGQETQFPFYFVVVATGTPIASGVAQATFTAVQTTLPNSVLASQSSASAASASAAAASSSLISASASLTQSGSGLSSSTGALDGGSVQGSNDNSSFPRWAIAVIVILGFFALAALVALMFLIIMRARRRHYDTSRRGSMGSQSPMMANVQSGPPLSPQVEAGEAAAGLGAGPTFGGAVAGKTASSAAHENDGESSTSENLFSGADAAVMAEAFRKALRKPEFADQPVEEGESPPELTPDPDRPELLSRELAEEGRDIRSVGSSRGVRVETLSDGGETATRHSTPRNSTG